MEPEEPEEDKIGLDLYFVVLAVVMVMTLLGVLVYYGGKV